MTTITVNVPVKVAVPRGARLVGALLSAAASAWVLWRESRVQREVAATRASEAAEVRAYANEVMSQDWRFAADLARAERGVRAAQIQAVSNTFRINCRAPGGAQHNPCRSAKSSVTSDASTVMASLAARESAS